MARSSRAAAAIRAKGPGDSGATSVDAAGAADVCVPMTADESLKKAQDVIRAVVASQHDRPSLVAQIACEVGADIVEGRIRPGEDLNTVELARRYQTSRTPVREALIILENEGLVDIPPRKRPRARIYSMEEVREIYRTRTALLEFVATDVATFATDEDIETLKAILLNMTRAVRQKDITAYVWLNVDFHDCNARLAQNATVKRIIDSLLVRTLAMRRISLSQPRRMEESLENHLRLVNAYEKRDSYMAGAILRAHHTEALANIEQYFERIGNLAPLSP
jgi:DNA-binding GntR family transcriptional regulator